jgi:HAAS domain-containing protein
MTADEYLRRVERELRGLPWSQRRELVSELRGHLSELPPDTDLEARLGSPQEYAADLCATAGLERRRGPASWVRARRPRNVILAVVLLTVLVLAIAAAGWVQTYQPLAFREKASAGGHVFLASGKGRPFRLGVDVENDGRFTVRVLGVPDSSGPFAGLPVSARVMMSRKTGGREKCRPFPLKSVSTARCVMFVRPGGGYEPFQPFDLKPGQVRSVMLAGIYGNCSGRPSQLTDISLSDFPVRYSFLWKTATAEIPLPREREILPPNNGCRSALSRTAPFHRLTGGESHVFRPGAIEIGDRIFCASHGARAGALVPHRGQSVVGTAVVGGGYVPSSGATIHLTTHADGSVVARCR